MVPYQGQVGGGALTPGHRPTWVTAGPLRPGCVNAEKLPDAVGLSRRPGNGCGIQEGVRTP